MPTTAKRTAVPYRVLVGIDYPDDKRAEAGDIVTDIPDYAHRWLLDQGIIEPVEED